MAVAKGRKSRRSSRRPAGRHHGSAPDRRPYREIEVSDVGKKTFRAFGKNWRVEEFIGRIMPGDVGKRVVLVGDIVQVENDQQRAARLRARPTFHTNTGFGVGEAPWESVRGSSAYGKGGRFGNAPQKISSTAKYQGWTNWVTWSVALWLGNDEPVYRAAQRHYAAHGPFTARSAEKFVRETWPRGTPDMRSPNYRGKHASYGAVDWQEIADSLNERWTLTGASRTVLDPYFTWRTPL